MRCAPLRAVLREDLVEHRLAVALPEGRTEVVADRVARVPGEHHVQGHEADRIATITCPIGLAAIAGKEPAVIAVSVAAALMQAVQCPVGATS